MYRLAGITTAFAIFAVSASAGIDPASIERVALEELQSTKTPGAAVAVVLGDQVISRTATVWPVWIPARQ